jgi:hypothetical protein
MLLDKSKDYRINANVAQITILYTQDKVVLVLLKL